MLILALVSVLLLSRLNNTAFWIDESMNGLLGQNVLKYGYPSIWDGNYLVEPYFDAELNHLVRVSHTWLQFYLTAASLALFGDTDIAARLPFALGGILSVAAIYFLSLRLAQDRRLAALSALLLATHTGFLLYSRLCRYFSICFLFTLLMALTYLRWWRAPRRWNLVLFTACSVVLFYDHYPIWPFLFLGVALHLLLAERGADWYARRFRPFLISSLVTAAAILPWLIYANPFTRGIRDWSGSSYWYRLKIFIWKSDTWVLPWIALLGILTSAALLSRWRRVQRQPAAIRITRDYLLLLSMPIYVITIILAPHPMLSSQYTAPLIPFAMIVGAFLVLRIRDFSRSAAAITLALLLATNVLQALPFMALEWLHVNPARAEAIVTNPVAQFNRGTPLSHYLSVQLRLRSPFLEYVYFISHSYDHRLKALVSYLKSHGSPEQTVLAPWHDADAIRFYSNMHVVYHFKPSFTIEPVKALVYRAGVKPDWIIPSPFYEPPHPFFKYDRDNYQRVYVAAPKDYIFENEPNLDYFTWHNNTDAPPGFYILKRKDLQLNEEHTTQLRSKQ
jgi:4-amino-4-deoxy-L-arabinose transferase-like glycosyltransferase